MVTATGTHTQMALSAAQGESPQAPVPNHQGMIHPGGLCQQWLAEL